jgi:hypothetical protein
MQDRHSSLHDEDTVTLPSECSERSAAGDLGLGRWSANIIPPNRKTAVG